MASNIPDSRLGRALMAGIPIALIMLGAELLDGVWKIDRNERGLELSWMAAGERRTPLASPALSLVTCQDEGCAQWTLAVSLPQPQLAAPRLAADVAEFANSVVYAVTGNCPDQRSKASRTLAMA